MLLAVANVGGVIAYVPLLTVLLPSRMAELAGADRVAWLAAATLAGAIAASIANVTVGWASDATGTRRGWAATGLGLTLASYALIHAAASPAAMVVAVATYQCALNMLLAPLAAWAAEAVPDGRKGLLGGLLASGPPVGALAGVVATAPAFSAGWMRLGVVCAMMVAAVAPVLILRIPPIVRTREMKQDEVRVKAARTDFALLWTARLIVQIAGGTVFGVLLYYFEAVSAPLSEAGVARLSAAAAVLALPVALRLGMLSDRSGRRKPFLVAASLAAAVGLAIMASATGFDARATGFVFFAAGSAVFVALHATYAMELLPSSRHRGRDLGILNLANTLPSVVAPLLTLWLVPNYGFAAMFRLLAVALVIAGGCILLVQRDGRRAADRTLPPDGPAPLSGQPS
ncbi:MFS transporter [Sphingomonas sp.]|uniref:MFS transporter n=1 Tax=Sphingomonas sp. TaxID=28214 RepID=UPI0035BC7DD9